MKSRVVYTTDLAEKMTCR